LPPLSKWVNAGEKVFRYKVPVDDEWHLIECGQVLHVAGRRHGVVEFWAIAQSTPHLFTAVGTGHTVPDGGAFYVGTALGEFSAVWHLFQKAADVSASGGYHPPTTSTGMGEPGDG
jgi:hypothetical protein